MARFPKGPQVFAKDDRALAAVEFALLLPFLVLLLFGGIDVTEAVMARRKVAQTANTLSDLVSQEKCVDDTFINAVFDVGAAILAPLDAAQLKATITNVRIDGNNSAVVDWSRGKNMLERAKGSMLTLSDDLAPLRKPNTSFVMAETAYNYKPVVGYAITGTMSMTDTTYALPRLAAPKDGVALKPAGC